MKKLLFLLTISLIYTTLCFGEVSFSGDDADTLRCGDIAAIDSSDDISISLWFRVNNITEDHYILSKLQTFSSPNRGGFLLFFDDSSTRTSRTNVLAWMAAFEPNGAGQSYIDSDNNSILADTWYHVVATSDIGGNEVKLYINGTEVTDSPKAQDANVTHDGLASELDIGDCMAINGNNIKGVITEVAVWTSILTDSEAKQLANSRVKGMPLQIQPSSLVGYWPLDDYIGGYGTIDGLTFVDRSGNGNDGTGVDVDDDSDILSEEISSYVDYNQYVNYTIAAAAADTGNFLLMF